MAQDINLMPQEAVQTKESKTSHTKSINVYAITVLLIAAAILISLFGYQLFLSAQGKRVATQTKQAEEEVLSQSAKEISRRALVEKIDVSSAFLNQRLKYSEAYKIILDIVKKSGVTLTEGSLQNDGSLSLSGESKSSANLKKLVAGLTSEDLKSDLEKIELVNLTKEKGEAYKFTIDYKYLKKGLLEKEAEVGNISNE